MEIPTDTKTTKKEEDEAALLLKRLQSQFGDIDISNIVATEEPKDNGDDDAESEESSVVDPTPEELKAWQDAQFKLGKWARDAKKEKELSESELAAEALKKRRQEKIVKSSSVGSWEEVENPPDLQGQESAFFTTPEDVELVGAHPLLTKLASNDSDMLGGKWLRLYSSGIAGDGLSFHHLLSALRGYDGPTVTIIGTIPSEAHSLANNTSNKGGGILGIYTATPWKESGAQFYGTDDCFLFHMDETKEEVSVIRPKSALENTSKRTTNNQNYMYCNASSSGNSADATSSAVYGIGVGGTPSKPRLHLTETLEQCRALPFDGTFEDGQLLTPTENEDSLYYFDVDALEVWGVGGEGWQKNALQARNVEQERIEANLRKARTVDKTQLLDDFRSGLFVADSNTLFSHVEHTVGRLDDGGSNDCRP